MKSGRKQKLVRSILSLLLVVAPVLASQQASTYLWGEPEVPESLRS
ncbi:MAG TPA: cyclic lactone autoinducer peptide [Mobilitalea sp.]|nr:cyclic lactone autoinducer peptide [Mobilitalea sp.]